MGLNKTPNIGLNNWLGNEYPKREAFAQDNLILDAEIKGIKDDIQEANEKINNIDLTADKVAIADTNNHFTSPDVEGALNELFQYADSGKTIIVTVIGSPLESTDSFSSMGTKISEQIVRGVNISNNLLNNL